MAGIAPSAASDDGVTLLRSGVCQHAFRRERGAAAMFSEATGRLDVEPEVLSTYGALPVRFEVVMFVIPSVDDWFQLARRYGQIDEVEPNPLKQYGIFACKSFIEDRFADRGKDVRILEIGHGFSPDVMSHFQDKHDVNGVDDDQKLHYFLEWNWDFLFDYHIAPYCKHVTFHRGLIGAGSQPTTLEEGSFDVIWSISILEEVKPDVVESIIMSAGKLLKPGGWLIGTHDLLVPNFRDRMELHLAAHRGAGLEIPDAPDPATLEIDWRYALLEDPVVVMLRYEGATPAEDRKFPGHYATMFTAARKPLA